MRPARGAAALAGVVALLSTASPALSGPSPQNVGDVIGTLDDLIGSPLQVQCRGGSRPTRTNDTPAKPFGQQSRRDELAPDLITAKFVPGARDKDVANLLDGLDATSVNSIPELDVRSLRVAPERARSRSARPARVALRLSEPSPDCQPKA